MQLRKNCALLAEGPTTQAGRRYRRPLTQSAQRKTPPPRVKPKGGAGSGIAAHARTGSCTAHDRRGQTAGSTWSGRRKPPPNGHEKAKRATVGFRAIAVYSHRFPNALRPSCGVIQITTNLERIGLNWFHSCGSQPRRGWRPSRRWGRHLFINQTEYTVPEGKKTEALDD